VALDLRDGRMEDARIALGGVATVPWRARTAEQALRGQAFDDAAIEAAANSAFAEARPHGYNAFKVALGRQTLARALRQAAALRI
jgi:xanthine dehydrogenase YagS FAD-binding subunit